MKERSVGMIRAIRNAFCLQCSRQRLAVPHSKGVMGDGMTAIKAIEFADLNTASERP